MRFFQAVLILFLVAVFVIPNAALFNAEDVTTFAIVFSVLNLVAGMGGIATLLKKFFFEKK